MKRDGDELIRSERTGNGIERREKLRNGIAQRCDAKEWERDAEIGNGIAEISKGTA